MKLITNVLAVMLTTTLISIGLNTANAGTIYKVIDENTGQVTFTDRPNSYQQDSHKQVVDTHIQTTSQPYAIAQSDSSVGTAAGLSESAPPVAESQAVSRASDYRLSLTSPESSRAYRRPAQTIDVQLSLSPALKSGDTVIIYLDGNEVAQGLTTSIATLDLTPGQHQLSAAIINANGDTINQVSRTIYIIQNTQALRQKKQLAEQLMAYKRLPWHQKVLLKLQQQNLPAVATSKSGNSAAKNNSKPAVSSAFN